MDRNNVTAADIAEQRARENWNTTLGTRHGRAVVMDILRMCQYGMSAFTGEDGLTNMISGKHKVAEGVTAMMNEVNPDAFISMLIEAKEDSLNDRANEQRNADDA